MSDVDEAFVRLQEAVDKEITSTNEKGGELFKLGQHEKARREMKKAEGLVSFKRQVEGLRRSYGKIGALRRGSARRQRVGGTPQEAFREPILEVLRQMGGKGKAREVVNRVGEMMKERLDNEVDQEFLSGGDPRWINRCWWGRNDLRQAGKIRGDSPRGTWELA